MRDTESKIHAVASTTRDWEYWVGLDGRVTHCSPACEQITGHAADEFLADPGLLLRLAVAPGRDVATHLLGAHTADFGPCHLQFRILSADGDIRWIEHACQPFYEHGRYLGRRGINRDITERKEAERLLLLQRDLARAVATARSLDETLRLCLNTAIDASGMDCGGVYLVRPDGGLALAQHEGLSDAFIRGAAIFDPASLNAALVRGGQTIYTGHAELVRAGFTLSVSEGLTAVAIVPILDGDQVVGCVNIASHSHAAVPPRARLALEAITAQIGPLIARERAVAALHDSEASLRSFFDAISDFLFVLDADATIRHINPAVVNRLGYREDELIGQSVLFVHPPERREEAARIVAAMREGRRAFCPVPLVTKDGRHIPVETIVTAGRYGGCPALFGVSRDVSERERAAAALRRVNWAAVGREVRMIELEREINTLCEAAGLPRRYRAELPSAPSGEAPDAPPDLDARDPRAAAHAAALHLMEDAIAALREGQDRILSIARVHDQLCQSPDLAALDFRAYVEGLIAHLERAHACIGPPVHLDLRMAPSTLGLNAAIPCALILNELVTNAFRHAFEGWTRDDDKMVSVAWADAGESWRLVVGDNGAGMPAGLDTTSPRTLGLRLVHMLARQLEGTVHYVHGDPGCRVEFEFPK